MSKELTVEELSYATLDDISFFINATRGLPTREGFKGNYMDKNDIEIPYSSGPHILKHFRDACEITRQYRILEIGFNIGHGAAMLLELGARVDSVDISDKWETLYAASFLKNKFPERFNYFDRSVFKKYYRHYGLVFIDGAHDEANITEDILLAKEIEIPYILFDDWYPRYGETQKAVAKFPELELVKDMNNLRLYKWKL